MQQKTVLLILLAFAIKTSLSAQPERWQQRVEYRMDIDFDAAKHQFKGKQKLKYFNNSPDELDRVFSGHFAGWNADGLRRQPGAVSALNGGTGGPADSRDRPGRK